MIILGLNCPDTPPLQFYITSAFLLTLLAFYYVSLFIDVAGQRES